jgi:hypothetical protein
MGRCRFNAGSEMTGSSDSGVNLRHNRHRIIVHLRQVTDLEPNRRILIPGLAGRLFGGGAVLLGAAYFRIWKCPHKGAVTSAQHGCHDNELQLTAFVTSSSATADHWLKMHEIVAPSAAFGRTIKSILSQDPSGGKPCGLINCKRPDPMGCQPYLAILLWLLPFGAFVGGSLSLGVVPIRPYLMRLHSDTAYIVGLDRIIHCRL